MAKAKHIPKKVAKDELTPQQAVFVREYLLTLNATQAAVSAGYSPNTAGSQGARLLKNAKVATAIEQGSNKRLTELDITIDRVLKERARLSFFDPRKLFDATGRPLRITELDDDTAAAIQGLDVQNVAGNEDEVGEVLKYKLASKDASLTALEHYLGMRKGDSEKGAVFNITMNLA